MFGKLVAGLNEREEEDLSDGLAMQGFTERPSICI